MPDRRVQITISWIACLSGILFYGIHLGFSVQVKSSILITSFTPPFIFHCLACLKLIRITKEKRPEKWKIVGRPFSIRSYLFNEISFGNQEIARAKGNCRWWFTASFFGLALIPLTLLVIPEPESGGGENTNSISSS